jgi:hypothetical protein
LPKLPVNPCKWKLVSFQIGVKKRLAIEKIGFSEKGDNRRISNTQRTGENRLQNFLTRSNFCELVASEFFNSHRI